MARVLRLPSLPPALREWFYGFAPPEHGAIVLGHRRVYIVPSRLGWLFGGTLLILLAGSINYTLSLGFGLTFLLAGMGLAGMVHTARNLAQLVIRAGRCEPAFAGDEALFRLHLANLALHDRPEILVRHLGAGAGHTLDLPAGAEVEARLRVPAPRRGWLPIGRVMLETRFPLGLFRAWSYVEPDLRCLVYPRPDRGTALPRPQPGAKSGGARALAQGNDDFAGLRSYQPSDSPRHVAWKSAARSDDLLTKQFSGEAQVELWLDWRELPAGMDVEARLSRLAGWVLAAEASGARYGLRIPGRVLAPDHGEHQRAACLEALALFEAGSP